MTEKISVKMETCIFCGSRELNLVAVIGEGLRFACRECDQHPGKLGLPCTTFADTAAMIWNIYNTVCVLDKKTWDPDRMEFVPVPNWPPPRLKQPGEGP